MSDNQQQFSLVLAVLGGVVLAYYYINQFGNKHQYPCLCQKCELQEQILQQEGYQRQIYGSQQVESQYGNVIGQIYGLVAIAIVASVLFAIYQSPIAQEVSGYGKKAGKKIGL